jgi:hypothetical protein
MLDEAMDILIMASVFIFVGAMRALAHLSWPDSYLLKVGSSFGHDIPELSSLLVKHADYVLATRCDIDSVRFAFVIHLLFAALWRGLALATL